MDYSFSVTSVARTSMEQAVTTFINQLKAGDYAAIVKFNNSNPNKASVVRAFTNRRRRARRPGADQAVSSDYPGVGTNLFDAVVMSVGEFNCAARDTADRPTGNHSRLRRRRERSSADINAAVAAAVAANISIFTVGVGDLLRDLAEILKGLPDETSGDFYPTPDAARLHAAYVQISQLLNNEYLLSFRVDHHRLPHPHARSPGYRAGVRLAEFTRCATIFGAGRARHDAGSGDHHPARRAGLDVGTVDAAGEPLWPHR